MNKFRVLLAGVALLGAFTFGCEDDVRKPATSPGYDPDKAVAETELGLTAYVWSWRNVSAALCADTTYRWRFDPDGTVMRDTVSDGLGDDGGSCVTSSSEAAGTYDVNELGMVLIDIDGVAVSWQPAVLPTYPYAQVDAGEVSYERTTDVLSTRLLVAFDPDTPERYVQSVTERDGASAGTIRTNLTVVFDRELSTGACQARVVVEVEHFLADGGLDSNDRQFDLPCHVEATGVDDWMALRRTDDPLLEEPPDATTAERVAHNVQRNMSSSFRPMLYYRASEPHRLVPAYSSCCDANWLRGERR